MLNYQRVVFIILWWPCLTLGTAESFIGQPAPRVFVFLSIKVWVSPWTTTQLGWIFSMDFFGRFTKQSDDIMGDISRGISWDISKKNGIWINDPVLWWFMGLKRIEMDDHWDPIWDQAHSAEDGRRCVHPLWNTMVSGYFKQSNWWLVAIVMEKAGRIVDLPLEIRLLRRSIWYLKVDMSHEQETWRDRSDRII